MCVDSTLEVHQQAWTTWTDSEDSRSASVSTAHSSSPTCKPTCTLCLSFSPKVLSMCGCADHLACSLTLTRFVQNHNCATGVLQHLRESLALYMRAGVLDADWNAVVVSCRGECGTDILVWDLDTCNRLHSLHVVSPQHTPAASHLEQKASHPLPACCKVHNRINYVK